MGIYSGECIYAGTARGRIHYLQMDEELKEDIVCAAGVPGKLNTDLNAGHPDTEMEKFEAARKAVIQLEQEYAQKAEREINSEAAKIFDSHALMLEDPELIDAVKEQIYYEQNSAALAVKTVCDSWISIFSALPDPYLSERALDIEEIANELQRRLIGTGRALNLVFSEAYGLAERWIVTALKLFPGDLISLNREKITGVVLGDVGISSHTAILLRSMQIPSLTHVNELSVSWDTRQAELSSVEGSEGWVLINELD